MQMDCLSCRYGVGRRRSNQWRMHCSTWVKFKPYKSLVINISSYSKWSSPRGSVQVHTVWLAGRGNWDLEALLASMLGNYPGRKPCIMGIRVIIPTTFHKQKKEKVQETLHKGHMGIVQMKMLAHRLVWWLGTYRDLEQLGRSSSTCQQIQKAPTAAPLHPWIWPSTPWARRIHWI